MTEKPRRRVQAKLRIEADSFEELARDLRNLALDIEMGNCRASPVISGGYSSGYVLTIDENPEITHESFFKNLRAYLRKEGRAEAHNE